MSVIADNRIINDVNFARKVKFGPVEVALEEMEPLIISE